MGETMKVVIKASGFKTEYPNMTVEEIEEMVRKIEEQKRLEASKK